MPSAPAVAAPADYVTGICCLVIPLEFAFFLAYFPYRIRFRYRFAIVVAGLFILVDGIVHIVAAALNSSTGSVAYLKLMPAATSLALALLLLWLVPDSMRFIKYTHQLEVAMEKKEGELVRRVADLSEANRAADKAHRQRGVFIASTSHEIRNPLHVILANAEFLRDTRLNADQRENVDTILDSAKQMSVVVDDTLNYSRLESGRMKLERIPVNLAALCASAVRDMSLQAVKKDVRIELHWSPRAPRFVVSDPTRLKQLLLNLLSNSLKFSPPRSAIGLHVDQEDEIRPCASYCAGDDDAAHDQVALPPSQELAPRAVSEDARHPLLRRLSQSAQFSDAARSICLDHRHRSPSPSLRIGIHDDPEHDSDEGPVESSLARRPRVFLRFTVNDPGVGISPAALGLLFRAYTQAKLSTVRQHGGSGLGLSICSLIIKNLEGCIQVTSEVDAGSEFSFLLDVPVSSEEEWKSDQPAPGVLAESALLSVPARDDSEGAGEGAVEGEGRPTVLVVDDNSTNRKILSRMLKKAGYVVREAADGLQALDEFKQRAGSPFACIFMDISMPHMDGHECTRQIRACEKKPSFQFAGTRTPIVALTGDAASDSEARCKESGMDRFMTKPLGKEKVLATLRAYQSVGRSGELSPAERKVAHAVPSSAVLPDHSARSSDSPSMAPRAFTVSLMSLSGDRSARQHSSSDESTATS